MSKDLRCYILLSDEKKKDLNQDFRNCISSLIKDARVKAGISSRDLSMLSGIDPSTLSRIEKGKYSLSISIFCRLLYCLGYDHLGIKN